VNVYHARDGDLALVRDRCEPHDGLAELERREVRLFEIRLFLKNFLKLG
jgi:hypothetical protein